MEEEDGAEEQQGGRDDRPGDLEEDAGVVDRADRLDADDVDEAGAIMARVANSTMSPWVGLVQMSLAKTVASATAVAAVPAMNASSAV